MFRSTIHASQPLPVGTKIEAELRGQRHRVSPPLERAAQELLVVVVAVDLRRVEEGAAELDGAVDRGDGLRLVGRAVGLAHAHTAKADRRDLKALLAKLPVFETHFSSSSFERCGWDYRLKTSRATRMADIARGQPA